MDSVNKGVVVIALSETNPHVDHANHSVAGYNAFLTTLKSGNCDLHVKLLRFDGFGDADTPIVQQKPYAAIRHVHPKHVPLHHADPLELHDDHDFRAAGVRAHQRQRFGDQPLTPIQLAKWCPMTPLSDMIGDAILAAETMASAEHTDRVTVVIVTDRAENFSRRHYQDDAIAMIRKKPDWNILLLAKNLEAVGPYLAKAFEIDPKMSIGYKSDDSEHVFELTAHLTCDYTKTGNLKGFDE